MQKSQMGMVSKELWFSESILAGIQFRLNNSSGLGIKKVLIIACMRVLFLK